MVRKKTTLFGKVILKRLIDIDKNQRWLADQCNVTSGQISRLISGTVKPSVKLLKRISKSLDIDSGELVNTLTYDDPDIKEVTCRD